MTHADRVVGAARRWLATPYQHQASLMGVGCDCLGLVRGVWRDVIGDEPFQLPSYAPDWAEATGDETLLRSAQRFLLPVSSDEIQPGEVLLFRWRQHLPAKHCAIATAHNLMIHAHDGAAVCEVPLSNWWVRHLAGRYRFPDRA